MECLIIHQVRGLIGPVCSRSGGRNPVLHTKHSSVISISQNSNLVVVGSMRVTGAANQSNDIVGHFTRLAMPPGARGGTTNFLGLRGDARDGCIVLLTL